MSSSSNQVVIGNQAYVLVPIAEYQRLAQAAAPAQTSAAARRERRREKTKKVAQALTAQRLKVGLTQKELARRANISPETLSRIEHGKHLPQAITFEKILQAMGVR